MRAFIHVALGHEGEALAAFSRLLNADPNATLGDEVAPKIQAKFSDVKRGIRELGGLGLEPVEEGSGGVWHLRLRPPSGVELVKVDAFVMPAGREQYESVSLNADGDYWSVDYHLPAGGVGPLAATSR